MVEKIEFDFCAASQADSQLEEINRRMKLEVMYGFEETMQGLSQAWGGGAGNQFRQLAVKDVTQMKQTVRLLEQAEAALKEAVLTAKRVEEKTREIANLRKY